MTNLKLLLAGVVAIAAVVGWVVREVSDSHGFLETGLATEPGRSGIEATPATPALPLEMSVESRDEARPHRRSGQAASWVDPSAMSPLFSRRKGVQDLPFALRSAGEYAECSGLNPSEEPLSDIERRRLERIIESAKREWSRLQDRALASRHSFIESRVRDYGEGELPGTPEAEALAKHYRESADPGFLATYSTPGDGTGNRVFLLLPGDSAFVDDCFDDLWAEAEKDYAAIAAFFVSRTD